MFDLEKLFPFTKPKPAAARSLYLPLVPRAKIRAFPWVDLPKDFFGLILEKMRDDLLEFKDGKFDSKKTIESLNMIAADMLSDRDHVIYNSVVVRKRKYNGKHIDVKFRLEYMFSQKLLRRINKLIDMSGSNIITPSNFIIDLI